uniref:KRAB domain-containing protein n=1 Tax=Pseudonaja textilis TaxID=8673 RepID=A0A670Z5W3_PSETE
QFDSPGILCLRNILFNFRDSVSFELVALYFMEEEWVPLDSSQRALLREIILENSKKVSILSKEYILQIIHCIVKMCLIPFAATVRCLFDGSLKAVFLKIRTGRDLKKLSDPHFI